MNLATHDATADSLELAPHELVLAAGGMINLYEADENPNQQPAGQTKSMIAWRTFGDVGL